MGMYDTVIVEADYPLKGLFPFDGDIPDSFQTKDLERLLDTYIITSWGRLIHKKVRYVENKKRSNRHKKGLAGLAGMLKSIPMGTEEIAYDGILEFYTSYGQQENGRFFVTYNASFNKGILKDIKLVEHKVF